MNLAATMLTLITLPLLAYTMSAVNVGAHCLAHARTTDEPCTLIPRAWNDVVVKNAEGWTLEWEFWLRSAQLILGALWAALASIAIMSTPERGPA